MNDKDRNDQPPEYHLVTSSEPILLRPTAQTVSARPITSQPPSSKNPLDYLDILWRRKWWVISLFLVCVVSALMLSFLLTPVYRSTATLEISEETKSSVNLGQNRQVAADQDYFATQLWILQNRSLSEQLLDRLKLDEVPEFSPSKGLLGSLIQEGKRMIFPSLSTEEPDEEKEASKRDKITDEIMSRIRVQNMGKSRLVKIDIESQDRFLVAKMLQTYIDLYLEHNLGKRRAESLEATSWLKQELASSERNLTKSRSALVDFTSKHGIVGLEKDLNHIAAAFNSSAEDLRKAKESRMKLLAFQDESKGGGISLPPAAHMEYLNKMREHLAILESEYAQLTAVYSPEFPKATIMKKKIDELRKKVSDTEKVTVESAVSTATKEEELSQGAFEKAKKDAMNLNSMGVQYAILKKEVETNEEIYHMLLQKTKEMEVTAGITGNNVTTIVKPTVPYRAVRPNKLLNLGVGALVGLMAGIVAGLLAEFCDTTVRTPEDLQRHMNVPALGVIPHIGTLKGYYSSSAARLGYEFLAHNQPRSPLYDALRNVQVAISSSYESPARTLIFSSASPQEGKTFVSVAMATVMSGEDMNVLLIDCDLRKPRVHKVFQMSNGVGLTTLLKNVNLNPLDPVKPSSVHNLNILTSGPIPENPVSLLMSRRMLKLLNEYRNMYDLLILDCPPVLGFSDARILSPYSDGVVMVVKQGQLTRKVLRQAMNSFYLSKGKIMGAIINMAHLENTEYNVAYGRHYGYPVGPYSVRRG